MIVVHSVSSWLPLTETWLFNQVAFLPQDIKSHIVCETTQNIDTFRLPNIHALQDAPRWRCYADKVLRKLRVRRHLGFLVRQSKQHGARLLHSHFGNVGWANLEAAERVGLKHVVTFYGLDVNYLPSIEPRWYARYKELFARVDRVLCEGPHMAQCIRDLGCPSEKVMVHHLGVRVDEIPFRPRVWKPGEPLRVLIAASFREKKGIPSALQALGRLREDLELEITVIGDAGGEARSQAEKRRIIRTIEECGLQARVRLMGYQPYAVVFDEAYRHHLFLSPSVTSADGDTEGGAPVTIIEMLATGMPVVSTTHCDIPEVIEHGVSGLLADERDVDGLERHLRWMVAHPEAWRAMAEAGRRRVEAEFNARVQGERLAAIYRELVD